MNPFYPDTRIGSVIIDLCIALSMTMPVNRVPAYLAAMGILVDRSSCRLYVQNISSYLCAEQCPLHRPDNLFGIHLPLSVLSLSALATDPDAGRSRRRIENSRGLWFSLPATDSEDPSVPLKGSDHTA